MTIESQKRTKGPQPHGPVVLFGSCRRIGIVRLDSAPFRKECMPSGCDADEEDNEWEAAGGTAIRDLLHAAGTRQPPPGGSVMECWCSLVDSPVACGQGRRCRPFCRLGQSAGGRP